jgi:membrane associated rhomboid family serine protease
MALHDRDYARAEPPRAGGFRRASGWSITTWIIVLCAAVFALDGFLPLREVEVRTELLPGVDPAEVAKVRADEFTFGPNVVSQQALPPQYRQLLRRDASMPQIEGLESQQAVYLGGRAVAVRQNRLEKQLASHGFFSTAKALATRDPVFGWTGFEVWRFVTFQFLHANLNHLLFNMLTLFFFGGMVEQYLGKKRYLAFYLLCGVAGAAMYLLLNGLGIGGQMLFGPRFHVPGLIFNDPNTVLVGASAGVFGVIMACAYLVPNTTVYLFFVIPMPLRTLAYGLLAIALLTVFFGWSNAGGEAAHIGGALAGYFLIRNPGHLHGFFDFLGQFDPTSRVSKARAATRRAGGSAEIDRILDKIKAQGLHSLTDAEKRALQEASRR